MSLVMVALSAATLVHAPAAAHAASVGGAYSPLPPTRILDTRDGTGGVAPRPLGPKGSLNVQVMGHGGVPQGATAVVLNVTVTDTSAASYLTVYPTGVIQPLASNLNWAAGETIPNLVEVGLGDGGSGHCL